MRADATKKRVAAGLICAGDSALKKEQRILISAGERWSARWVGQCWCLLWAETDRARHNLSTGKVVIGVQTESSVSEKYIILIFYIIISYRVWECFVIALY